MCVILEGDSAFRGDLSPEPVGSRSHYLFLLDDADPGLDVGEGMHGGEDSVPPVLLLQLSPGPPLQGERGGVHEPSQIEILLKVRYPVFHLILIKVGLHESDLYVGLRGKRWGKEEMSSSSSHHPGCTGEACWDTALLLHPWARPKATEAERVRPDVSHSCSAPPGRQRAVGEKDKAACPCEVRSPSCPSTLNSLVPPTLGTRVRKLLFRTDKLSFLEPPRPLPT